MTRRDRLVELACLWQEIRADRPPMHHPRDSAAQAVSPDEDPRRTDGVGARSGEYRTAPTASR
jgi:hypothetical protein